MNAVKVTGAFEAMLDRAGGLHSEEAFDMFAREGDWQSFLIQDRVKSLEAWEINPDFIPNLRKNLPRATIHCLDSIATVNAGGIRTFGLVVADNGLNCYGEGNRFCEHFDFIRNIGNVVRPGGFLIFNVARKPFGYEQFPEWRARREAFYGTTDTADLSLTFIESFYRALFRNAGRPTSEFHLLCREHYGQDDYLYYAGVRLA